jgi:FG-GAP-like repeat
MDTGLAAMGVNGSRPTLSSTWLAMFAIWVSALAIAWPAAASTGARASSPLRGAPIVRGVSGYAVRAADLTGDGTVDLAVTGYSQNVWVVPQRRDGSFSQPVGYAMDGFIEGNSLALADFNGDGRTDLAAAAFDYDGSRGVIFAWVQGQQGGLEHRVEYTIGDLASGLSAGDVNEDGKTDLVAVSLGRTAVLLGQGDGTFAGPEWNPCIQSCDEAALADMNGDGHLDLVVTGPGTTLGILLGDGDGHFAKAGKKYVTWGSQDEFTVADLDGNGTLDVTIAIDHKSMPVWLNRGDGTLRAGTSVSVNRIAENVSSADFDRDGVADLVVIEGETMAILRGAGEARFGRPQIHDPGSSPADLTTTDVDSDGVPDVIVVGIGGVSILYGTSKGGVVSAPSVALSGYASPGHALSETDLNGDGHTDLLMVSGDLPDTDGSSPTRTFRDRPRLIALVARGDGSFAHPRACRLPHAATDLDVADLDGDGWPDAVVTTARPAIDNVFIYLGNGDGTFAAPRRLRIGRGAARAAVGDATGDGRSDVIVTTDGATVEVLPSQGDGTFGAPITSDAGAGTWGPFEARDLDGNGTLDLALTQLVPNGFGSYIGVSLGDGRGRFARSTTYSVTTPAVPTLAVGDLNADGRPDLVIAGRLTVAVLLSTGEGTFGDQMLYGPNLYPIGLAIADLTGDGIADVAVASLDGAVLIYPGKGDGSLRSSIDYAYKPPRATEAGTLAVAQDLDGDGRADLAVCGGGGVVILMQRSREDEVSRHWDANGGASSRSS